MNAKSAWPIQFASRLATLHPFALTSSGNQLASSLGPEYVAAGTISPVRRLASQADASFTGCNPVPLCGTRWRISAATHGIINASACLTYG